MSRVDCYSQAAGPLHGEVVVPGDKSVSHRALMLAAIAEGSSHISGFLEGEDTRATAAILQRLGVNIQTPAARQRIVHGVGLHGLRGIEEVLDCGNAGTGMRLLCGLLAGQAFDSVLIGDASLSKRPMRRVVEPLTAMGAHIDSESGCLPPLHIHGACRLEGMRHAPAMASAQVKSALLLAGLYAHGETEIVEQRPTRDYTERMLAAFGWPLEFAPGRVSLSGGHSLRAHDIEVPSDFSSAAFFIVAACLIAGSSLRLCAVGLNPRRTGLLAVLQLMGADIQLEHRRVVGGEAVADIVVRHAPLHGIDVPLQPVADMIDEFPILFIAAAVAKGRTVICGAAELRVKESDRIAVMAAGLRKLGVEVIETDDGAVIEGCGGMLDGGEVASHGDHRVAMSFAVAGALARRPVLIRDCAAVATSFPNFFELANACAMRISLSPGMVDRAS